jgi:hypothetical protein
MTESTPKSQIREEWNYAPDSPPRRRPLRRHEGLSRDGEKRVCYYKTESEQDREAYIDAAREDEDSLEDKL